MQTRSHDLASAVNETERQIVEMCFLIKRAHIQRVDQLNDLEK